MRNDFENLKLSRILSEMMIPLWIERNPDLEEMKLIVTHCHKIGPKIGLLGSSSHENYVFMCDAEKSIPKSENLIIL